MQSIASCPDPVFSIKKARKLTVGTSRPYVETRLTHFLWNESWGGGRAHISDWWCGVLEDGAYLGRTTRGRLLVRGWRLGDLALQRLALLLLLLLLLAAQNIAYVVWSGGALVRGQL